MGMIVKTGFWYDGGPQARRCVEAGLGNFVIGVTNAKDAALSRKKKMYFMMPAMRDQGTFEIGGAYFQHAPKKDIEAMKTDPKAEIAKISEAGGEYFGGLSMLHEYGGLVYWPREYLTPSSHDSVDGREGCYRYPDEAGDLVEAKENYLRNLRKVVAKNKSISESPTILICSSMLHKYHLEGGIDTPGLEIFPGDVYMSIAALRGAARAYGREFGAFSAMICQGGCYSIEELWFKKHKLSLYYSYMAGADIVATQYGAFGLKVRRTGQSFGVKSRRVREHVKTAMDFFEFCKTHPRPKGGPKISLGILHGNLDGNAGLWIPWVWGQRGDEADWKHGDPERGWNYLDQLHKREPWYRRSLEGHNDFSGNPPDGQYDIVPVEADLGALSRYRCLVMLGWNTMTPEIYDKLKAYVAAGGHLIMAVPLLSTQTRRSDPIKLLNDGDFRDLFGVVVKGKGVEVTAGHKFIAESSIKGYQFPQWGTHDPVLINGEYPLAEIEVHEAKVLCQSKGTYHTPDIYPTGPVLVENRIGKGTALLITSWCYPGSKEMELFVRELLKDISAGEQGRIKLSGSDMIRYAVYEEDGLTTIYLLNTDYEAPASTNLWIGKKVVSNVTIDSCEMRIAYLRKACLCIPYDRSVHVEDINVSKDRCEVLLIGAGKQTICLYPLTGSLKKARFNGKAVKVESGNKSGCVRVTVKLSGKVDVLKLNR